MTDVPTGLETPTEIAKRLWDTAVQHLESATEETNVLVADSYVRIGQLALAAARFALDNQALLYGLPLDGTPVPPGQYGMPAGAPALPSHLIWGQTP